MVPPFTAGCRTISLRDAEGGPPFPVLLLYPATAPEADEQLGPYAVRVALDAPPAPGTFPLVVISHGSGGSHLAYRTLALHLARRGSVVACPEHPGNNRNRNDLAGTATLLRTRPEHVRQVIDAVLADNRLANVVRPDRVAVVGHSMGGGTALALAGGKPIAFPHESPDGIARPVPVVHDERVKALVLLAPATPWFMAPGALAAVRVPILMRTAQHDTHTSDFHASVVRHGVPDASRLDHAVVPNAGHFSFLAPFPPAMARPDFPPAHDPPGFDRAAYQELLCAEVEAFLDRSLRVA